jgi:hypothetical protein
MDTVSSGSIPIRIGQEDDGRWWADIESMPGVGIWLSFFLTK